LKTEPCGHDGAEKCVHSIRIPRGGVVGQE
jgi:hypothetical protein